MKAFATFLWLLLAPALAFAQSSPGLYTGQVPTSVQWNSYFAAKQDYLGFTPINPSTMVGTLPVVVTAGSGIVTIACPTCSGSVISSVTNSDGTLTISPTTGAVVASLNLAHSNTWTVAQTFGAAITLSGGVIGASPTPQLAFSDYYDDAGAVSVSHIRFFSTGYGIGLSANSLNYIVGNAAATHNFYTVGDLTSGNAALTVAAYNTASTTTATGAVLVRGGLGVTGAVNAGSMTLGAALPVASGGTGITAFGTGVATALGVNTGSSGAFGVLIASGAKALATGAISSATCTTAQTDTATGAATTDAVSVSFSADPTATTGYVPLTTGMLTIIYYPTSNTMNFKVCNNTASSITPGAVTVNWRIIR